MGIRVQRTSQNEYRVLLLDNWLPLGSLADAGAFELIDGGIKRFGAQIHNNFISLLTPAATLPVEQLAGRSLFTGRPFLPERREFLNIGMDDRLSSILRTVRVLSVADRFIGLPRGKTYGGQVIQTLTGISTSSLDTKRGKRQRAGATRARIQDLRGALRRVRRRDTRDLG